MPRREIIQLVDDLDGKELPEDTSPVRLSLGRTTYNLYLSEDNHGKLLKALDPFITDAETEATASQPTPVRSSGASNPNKERNAKVRHWAIETGYEYENARQERVTLGDRGRIPEAVVKAWQEAGSPEIGA